MTKAVNFHPTMRLERVMNEPGGIYVSEALSNADARLETIRDHCLDGVTEKIDRMRRIVGRWQEGTASECYALSNQVYAESGAFGLAEVSQVAYSLCYLLAFDELAISKPAVRVHIEALAALRSPRIEQSDEMREAVVSGLRDLTHRLTR